MTLLDIWLDIKKLNLNDPSLWPKSYQYAACVLIVLLVFGLAWYVSLASIKERYSYQVSQQQQLFVGLIEKMAQLSNQEFKSKDLVQLNNQLTNLKHKVINSEHSGDIYALIRNMAANTGVKVEQLLPIKQTNNNKIGYLVSKVNLVVSGEFKKLIKFLHLLGNAKLVTEDFSLSSINSGELLQLELLASIYREKPYAVN